jgi:predicted ATPase/transcriptional regulator with XRE-family HTH domain
MDDTRTFGRWLKAQRATLGLTQEQLAERIGYSVETIHKIEAGKRRPSQQAAELLAACLTIAPEARAAFLQFARPSTSGATGLPPEVPAGQRVASPGAWPMELTPLVGRDAEVTALAAYLRRPDIRLLSLTGPPGVGKTRLALRLAVHLAADFADGAFFVDLEPVGTLADVGAAVQRVLGLGQEAGQGDPLPVVLGHKQILLILDNFEHVILAGAQVVCWLEACPGLKVLITSRDALQVRAERLWPVAPLTVPDPARLPRLPELAGIAAVALFVDRAGAAQPDFALTPENAPLVAAICAQLEGLPLAIELAAAHIRLFSPATLLEQLQAPLRLLTGGPRDLPLRQRTLRAAIDWSYDLLDPAEQRLFRRLSVFAGGFSAAAAEAVANTEQDLPWPVLDGLAALVHKSLLRGVPAPGGDREPRFAMLAMIGEYARERLAASAEEARVREAHTRFYLALAEQGQPAGEAADVWLARLEADYANLQAALDGSRMDPAGTALALRLVVALGPFWMLRGPWAAGRAQLERVLARPSPPDAAPQRALALLYAAVLAKAQSDHPAARPLLLESLAVSRSLGDKPGAGRVLLHLAHVDAWLGDAASAREYARAALALSQEIDDKQTMLVALDFLDQGSAQFGLATALVEEHLPLSRTVADKVRECGALITRGWDAFESGELDTARRQTAAGLALARELGSQFRTAQALLHLGNIARAAGEVEQVAALYEESLAIQRTLENKVGIAWVRFCQGFLAARQEAYEAAEGAFVEGLAL